MAFTLAIHFGQAPSFAQARQFPAGSIERSQDLPPGKFRKRLEQLPAAPRGRALGWLKSFHFTEHDLQSLQIDSEGGIFYIDPPLEIDPTLEPADPTIAQAAIPAAPFPATLQFHSRPGAPNVIFLNFSGETVTGTQWNTELGRAEIIALPFSTDSDFSTFSDSEQIAIKQIWERVAEDYAPFNVDVTTQRPTTFSTRTAHALITRKAQANGQLNPASEAGGVAYANVFNTGAYSRYRPAWIYYDNLGNNPAYTAEALAHEIGHNLGLSHDGRTDGQDYYSGHGNGETSWGPIMGAGYNRNVSQWSKGDYYLASNTQDDLAVIANKLSYLTDDHANTTTSAATPLLLSSATNITSTTPETDPTNSSTANKGAIQRNTDIDVFSFTTGSGPIRITVNPWITPSHTRGNNLDIRLDLHNETGDHLTTIDPPSNTGATLATNLPPGTYFLGIRNSAAGSPLTSSPTGYTTYGSLGQYFITGYIAPTTSIETPANLNLAINNLTREVTLNWTPAPGALYTIESSDNIQGPFTPIPGAVNLPPTAAAAFTIPAGDNSPHKFYRLLTR